MNEGGKEGFILSQRSMKKNETGRISKGEDEDERGRE